MLMRFDPFAEFDRLASNSLSNSNRGQFMTADGYRQDDRFWLHLDVPGIDPDTIDVTVEKNTLSVSVERPAPGIENPMVINERLTGKFTRQFFLGEGLDVEKVEAGYDHGVLTVTIPVAEVAKPRKIQVGKVHEAIGS